MEDFSLRIIQNDTNAALSVQIDRVNALLVWITQKSIAEAISRKFFAFWNETDATVPVGINFQSNPGRDNNIITR
jgi:hypothetical protein